MEQYAPSLITLLTLWLLIQLRYTIFILHNGQQKTWIYVKNVEELRSEISILCDQNFLADV